MVIAYLRVSTERQHLENQKAEIERYAQARGIMVNRWITEIISGKTNANKRKLGGVIRKLNKGDTLIVTEISRLSRTLHEIMAIMGDCLKRNITIYSTKDGYSFDDSINSKVLSFAFGLVAEIERNLISQRTKEALALRKSQGIKLGRQTGVAPKLKILREHSDDVCSMIKNGYSIEAVCVHYKVSRSTFRNFRFENENLDKLLREKK